MSIFKSIFGNKNSSSSYTMTFDQAADIAGTYGEILEHNAPAPGTVADASKLPYSKNIIKQAIITLLNSDTDPQMKEHLKSAYWFLSDWQEGVGNTNAGLDLSNMDLSADPIELAKQMTAQKDTGKQWTEKAETERQQLRAELHQLGHL